MHFLKTLRLLLSFYRNFFLVTGASTLCAVGIFWMHGMPTFVPLFWFKIASLGLVYYQQQSYKAKEFYYYQNAGLSRGFLWSCTLGFDFALFLLSITISHELHAA